MSLLDTFKEKAKANKRKIVLPEGNELRTMQGAVIAAKEGLADPILLGDEAEIRALAEKTGLPLVHLDSLYWKDNWESVGREVFDARLEQELNKPKWILDGNMNRTLPHRLKYCKEAS